jgi:hypothetical protein
MKKLLILVAMATATFGRAQFDGQEFLEPVKVERLVTEAHGSSEDWQATKLKVDSLIEANELDSANIYGLVQAITDSNQVFEGEITFNNPTLKIPGLSENKIVVPNSVGGLYSTPLLVKVDTIEYVQGEYMECQVTIGSNVGGFFAPILSYFHVEEFGIAYETDLGLLEGLYVRTSATESQVYAQQGRPLMLGINEEVTIHPSRNIEINGQLVFENQGKGLLFDPGHEDPFTFLRYFSIGEGDTLMKFWTQDGSSVNLDVGGDGLFINGSVLTNGTFSHFGNFIVSGGSANFQGNVQINGALNMNNGISAITRELTSYDFGKLHYNGISDTVTYTIPVNLSGANHTSKIELENHANGAIEITAASGVTINEVSAGSFMVETRGVLRKVGENQYKLFGVSE